MIRPQPNEAAPYYFTYIDRVANLDIVGCLTSQMEEAWSFFSGISGEKSLSRYGPGKWSIREVLNHLSDVERTMLFRAYWFARNFDSPLPSFDQNVAVAAARADDIAWEEHLGEFRAVREATIAFFRNLPEEAWSRAGIASGNSFTVRALAFLLAGHVIHHMDIVRERYL